MSIWYRSCLTVGRDAFLYETIKRIAFTELKHPVPTQCIQSAKIKNPRGQDAYTGNLIMKIQVRRGAQARLSAVRWKYLAVFALLDLC